MFTRKWNLLVRMTFSVKMFALTFTLVFSLNCLGQTNLKFVAPNSRATNNTNTLVDTNEILQAGIGGESLSNEKPDISPADILKQKPLRVVPAVGATPPHSETLGEKVELPYDPIEDNGEYFVGWEKPKVSLVLSGLLEGYIEPCGCAGMDRMKGGLSRRHAFISELKEKGWNPLCIDAGQIANGFGVQAELKFDMAMNAFRLMEYHAIGMGKSELKFPAYFLLTFTAPPHTDGTSNFVSANVALYAFNDLYTLPCKVIEGGGVRIGVTSVVCLDSELAHRDENILIEDPATRLKMVLPRLQAEKCDKLVLIVHGTESEATELGRQFPEFGIIIVSDGPSVPPAEPKIINSNQYLIEPGEKGKYALVLGLYDSPTDSIRYQRVALDSRYTSSEEVRLLMEEYQGILRNLIQVKGYKSGLGLGEIESPKRAILGDFVGSNKCESCHEESFRIWRRNSHSSAWNSLKKTAIPPRDFDAECISCHVVGWHEQEYFPYIGGFMTEEATPHLTNVGCENCHGPGSKHIEAEMGNNSSLQNQIRTAMQLGTDTKKVCFACHDADNSPDFDFETYYPKIEHKEK